MRTLTDEDVDALARRIIELRSVTAATELDTLRNVYTPEQFAAEVLCGNRSAKWVRDQCKARKIATVTRRPWLIPQSEAIRFIAPNTAARPVTCRWGCRT